MLGIFFPNMVVVKHVEMSHDGWVWDIPPVFWKKRQKNCWNFEKCGEIRQDSLMLTFHGDVWQVPQELIPVPWQWGLGWIAMLVTWIIPGLVVNHHGDGKVPYKNRVVGPLPNLLKWLCEWGVAPNHVSSKSWESPCFQVQSGNRHPSQPNGNRRDSSRITSCSMAHRIVTTSPPCFLLQTWKPSTEKEKRGPLSKRGLLTFPVN